MKITPQSIFLYTKSNSNKFLNNLFVLYMFFLPLTGPTSTVYFLILFLFLIRGDMLNNIKVSLSNPVVFSFFLLFCVSIIWMIGTNNLENIPIELKRMKIFLYPIVFFSFLRPQYVPKAILAFMLGMLVSEITSYAIFFHIIEPIFYKGYANFDPSPFLHHSHYGLLLAITAGILFYRLIESNDKPILKITTFIFFTTVTINIFITGGRMGYVLYVISIFTILIMHKTKIYKTILITAVLSITVFTLAYNFSPLFQKRFQHSTHALQNLNTAHPFNSSLGARLGLMYYAEPTIKENFFFGVGTGDHLESVYAEIKKENKDLFLLSVPHFHNAHLVILVQFGLIGLLIWLNIFYQSLKYKQENHFMTSILSLIIVLLFFNSFLAAVFQVQIAAILTALMTTLLVYTKQKRFDAIHFSIKELLFYIVAIPLFIIIKEYT